MPSDFDEPIPIHTRNYTVDAWASSERQLLIRGTVQDTKPPGLYIADDPEPLTIHKMVVEMDVTFPALEIIRAEVTFHDFPNHSCPSIVEHYDKLVGLSIARGFTHKVRELFGGPRGCTHTTALLQAMAPVAVQCGWSMRVLAARRAGDSTESIPEPSQEQREAMFRGNINTCHVWDEHGQHVELVRKGRYPGPPLNVMNRLEELGRNADEWMRLKS